MGIAKSFLKLGFTLAIALPLGQIEIKGKSITHWYLGFLKNSLAQSSNLALSYFSKKELSQIFSAFEDYSEKDKDALKEALKMGKVER